jgi:hypothetical protein
MKQLAQDNRFLVSPGERTVISTLAYITILGHRCKGRAYVFIKLLVSSVLTVHRSQRTATSNSNCACVCMCVCMVGRGDGCLTKMSEPNTEIDEGKTVDVMMWYVPPNHFFEELG